MDDIRRAGQRICYVHGADNDGVRWTHEALGKGNVDWEGIVRALVEINYNGYICTQSWSELPNDVDSVMRESREYLELVCKKVGVGSKSRRRISDLLLPEWKASFIPLFTNNPQEAIDVLSRYGYPAWNGSATCTSTPRRN